MKSALHSLPSWFLLCLTFGSLSVLPLSLSAGELETALSSVSFNVTASGSGKVVEYSFLRKQNSVDYQYEIQSSPDLVDWSNVLFDSAALTEVGTAEVRTVVTEAVPEGTVYLRLQITSIPKTITLQAGMTINNALSLTKPGDTLVLPNGNYAKQTLTKQFPADVTIKAQQTNKAIIAGMLLSKAQHLSFRGIKFTDPFRLDGASDITIAGCTLDAGASTEGSLEIYGQGANGPTHHITVENCTISNGGRTIFFAGHFAPSENWNHDIVIRNNQITCGTNVGIQISGGRDLLITENKFNTTRSGAILTAGATRVEISRNRIEGPSLGMQIATPGREWDPFSGVEHMISSDILVANNVIISTANSCIMLSACHDISIVYNTLAGTGTLSTIHRTPHDYANKFVILEGNSNIRVWNNIMERITLDTLDPRPVFESHNLVRTGGAGDGLITSDPKFSETTTYSLSASSPALDKAIFTDDTPTVDFTGEERGSPADLGAMERF
ncbi:MAG: right-handed parallel beta-helix repeat-containing protein [Verrucomicrobiota bacterium]|nr:right-handed parallel beta-helix repeat-containing protein [Verrucomicrobiota bacterium]